MQEKFDTIENIDLGEGYGYYITPAPRFGKQFKPIKIYSECFDEGEGYADVCLYEVKWLGVEAWDIYDDWWRKDDDCEYGRESREFVQEILERFYKLVEQNAPQIQEYLLTN